MHWQERKYTRLWRSNNQRHGIKRFVNIYHVCTQNGMRLIVM